MQIVYTSTNNKSAAYRSVIAIILGLVLVIWPSVALKYIIMLIGLTFLLIGLISFIIAYRSRKEHTRNLAPFSGIGSMALGLLLICIPDFFQAIFMFLLGFILVLASIGQFVSLAAARQFGHVSPVSYFFPVLILIAGLVVIFKPFETATNVCIVFGVAAIFYGVTDLINQYEIRKLRRKNEAKEQIVKMEGEPDVEDAEYEEL